MGEEGVAGVHVGELGLHLRPLNLARGVLLGPGLIQDVSADLVVLDQADAQ